MPQSSLFSPVRRAGNVQLYDSHTQLAPTTQSRPRRHSECQKFGSRLEQLRNDALSNSIEELSEADRGRPGDQEEGREGDV